jgi:hypothetical protein
MRQARRYLRPWARQDRRCSSYSSTCSGASRLRAHSVVVLLSPRRLRGVDSEMGDPPAERRGIEPSVPSAGSITKYNRVLYDPGSGCRIEFPIALLDPPRADMARPRAGRIPSCSSTPPAPCTPEAPRTPGSVTSTLQRGVISILLLHPMCPPNADVTVSAIYKCHWGRAAGGRGAPA